jgi:hypothetical protein
MCRIQGRIQKTRESKEEEEKLCALLDRKI